MPDPALQRRLRQTLEDRERALQRLGRQRVVLELAGEVRLVSGQVQACATAVLGLWLPGGDTLSSL